MVLKAIIQHIGLPFVIGNHRGLNNGRGTPCNEGEKKKAEATNAMTVQMNQNTPFDQISRFKS